MFNLLKGLTQAVVSVAVTPVALAVDIVTLPAKIVDTDPNAGIFDATTACLKSAERGIKEAGKP
jgi:hypothetical protein